MPLSSWTASLTNPDMAKVKTSTFLRDSLILFLGVLAASYLLDGIQYESTPTLILVAIVLALLNMIIKPILVLFTLPFVIFTLGLGVLLINAVLLYFAGALVPGFEVLSFGTAFWGALIISLISIMVNIVFAPKGSIKVTYSKGTKRKIRGDDVIDV